MPRKTSTELTKKAVDAAQPGDWLWDGGTRGVSGFGLRVTPAGAKSFIFRYRNGEGRQRVVTLGAYPALTVEQARELAKRRAHEVAGGTDPIAARRALRSAPTVSDLADYYLGPYAASKPLRAATVSAARHVLHLVQPTLGKMKVPEVTADEIRRARAKVKALGLEDAKRDESHRAEALRLAQAAEEKASRALHGAQQSGARTALLALVLGRMQRETIRARRLAERAEAWARSGRAGVHQANRLLAVLGAMFSLAIEQGARADNPCKAIKKEREDERWRNLSEAEVGALLRACDAYEAENAMEATARGAADAVRLLLFSGARLREVLGAEWSQFDLERGLWEKPSAHTKAKRQHRLELEGPALDLLRDMKERAVHPRFLFPGDPQKGRQGKAAAAKRMVKPRVDLQRPWSRIVELANLTDVRIHDLRRTTASFMLSSGASLAVVGKSLGHTQARTTSRYAQLAPSVQREGLRVAGEKMAALARQPPNAKVVSLKVDRP